MLDGEKEFKQFCEDRMRSNADVDNVLYLNLYEDAIYFYCFSQRVFVIYRVYEPKQRAYRIPELFDFLRSLPFNFFYIYDINLD